MGVVGYGDIGQSAAKLAQAFGMSIVAVRRRAQLSEQDKQEGVLSEVYGNDDLPKMVAKCDYIVMATPYTDKTHKLFDAAAIGAMQQHAVFINIGRGKCVDEEALVAALQDGAPRTHICLTRHAGQSERTRFAAIAAAHMTDVSPHEICVSS